MALFCTLLMRIHWMNSFISYEPINWRQRAIQGCLKINNVALSINVLVIESNIQWISYVCSWSGQSNYVAHTYDPPFIRASSDSELSSPTTTWFTTGDSPYEWAWCQCISFQCYPIRRTRSPLQLWTSTWATIDWKTWRGNVPSKSSDAGIGEEQSCLTWASLSSSKVIVVSKIALKSHY